MFIKKSNGQIFGASLTASERKAMEIEIMKAMREYDENNMDEIDSAVLCVLHEEFGFGPKRMKRFHHAFVRKLNALCKRYDMHETEDKLWLCRYQAKEYGAKLEEWNKEIEE